MGWMLGLLGVVQEGYHGTVLGLVGFVEDVPWVLWMLEPGLSHLLMEGLTRALPDTFLGCKHLD